MTALHLAAKFGHTNVLMVLEDKVPWTSVSTKVVLLNAPLVNLVLDYRLFLCQFYVVVQWFVSSCM